jgi:hypothetical protein
VFFICDFCSKKCVIRRQNNYQKKERQLIEKVEIKNRIRFEKVVRKFKPNLTAFDQKNG